MKNTRLSTLQTIRENHYHDFDQCNNDNNDNHPSLKKDHHNQTFHIKKSLNLTKRITTQPSHLNQISSRIHHSYSKNKLSPMKQCNLINLLINQLDQTKLKLSSQSWMVYDLNKNLYKRGWSPNKPSQFNGLFRLLIVYVVSYLQKQLNSKMSKFEVKINLQCLRDNRQQAIKLKKQLIKKNLYINKQQKILDTFLQNTIVKFDDLIAAMILTGHQDLLQYSASFTGYLLYCLKQQEHVQDCCYFEKPTFSDTYLNIFVQHCNKYVFKNLNLKDTKVTNKYQFFSTPNQLCTIFVQSLKDKYVRNLYELQKLTVVTKCQTGFKFWQQKQKKFFNTRPHLGNDYFCVFNYRGKRNFGAISFNKILNIVIVLQDCKLGMVDSDIKIIQDWVRIANKPIVNSPKKIGSTIKLKPLLDLLEKQDIFALNKIN